MATAATGMEMVVLELLHFQSYATFYVPYQTFQTEQYYTPGNYCNIFLHMHTQC